MAKIMFKGEFEEVLMSGAKKQTIRLHVPRGVDLHIWLGTRWHPIRKLGISRNGAWSYKIVAGKDFTEAIAVADGFDSVQEMKKFFMKTYDWTMRQVEEYSWVVINFKWSEGPHAT